MDLEGFIACLDQEHRALEALSFKLNEERLILIAGQQEMLDRATAAVEDAAEELMSVGRRRSALLREMAGTLGLTEEATLREIAAAMPAADDRRRLDGLRQAMRRTMQAVRDTSEQNRLLLARGLAATMDALSLLGAPTSYDSSGTTHRPADRPILLDARI